METPKQAWGTTQTSSKRTAQVVDGRGVHVATPLARLARAVPAAVRALLPARALPCPGTTLYFWAFLRPHPTHFSPRRVRA
jgi:hypothetical protein